MLGIWAIYLQLFMQNTIMQNYECRRLRFLSIKFPSGVFLAPTSATLDINIEKKSRVIE